MTRLINSPSGIVVLGVALSLAPTAALAQWSAEPGERIRVHLPGGEAPVEARLVRLDDAEVVYLVDGMERQTPLHAGTRVEVARRRTNVRRGALAGALAGAALGLTVSLETDGECTGWECSALYDADDARIPLVIGGVLLGAGLGALLGLTIRTEIWEPIGPGALPPTSPGLPGARAPGPPALSFGMKLRI